MCLRSETSVRTRPDMANSRIPRTSISKRVLVQTLSSENEFDLYANEPHSHECFLTKTRFDTEAKGYSEIKKPTTNIFFVTFISDFFPAGFTTESITSSSLQNTSSYHWRNM